MTLILWTYDWVPQGPRGHVRDIRLRWACEETGLPYTIASIRFEDRTGPDHLARQPFAQVPALQDGEITLFESGACLLHLSDRSEHLMPRDGKARAETLEWLIAGLNSIEMVTVPWWFIGLSSPPENPLDGWLASRLSRLEAVLAGREWLAAGRFTVADLLMADILRVKKLRAALGPYPALAAYTTRVLDRPAFRKAYQDQLDHFAAADAARAN
ncbi:glutathione S-transferase family protein [Tabrizicola sp.]|uniref:glutathione S-transferase family protein n=1 Tax=Tabrizicola sp. TaxID=2005166 RepID=UPI001A47085B|nr:glutathione S-transferase family protein [Tabrizicola sp.]MBL9073089.1 glutathione S-transferase family protein [Tabrizicola sp.]